MVADMGTAAKPFWRLVALAVGSGTVGSRNGEAPAVAHLVGLGDGHAMFVVIFLPAILTACRSSIGFMTRICIGPREAFTCRPVAYVALPPVAIITARTTLLCFTPFPAQLLARLLALTPPCRGCIRALRFIGCRDCGSR
jgi:hypothetical protein